LSSIEAGDVSPELIKCLQGCKKLCRHLHIPIQSGDDHILKLMNRKYNRQGYEDLIIKLKAAVPGLAITTDCLIGFPGETEENFNNTLELVKKIMPLKVHIFPYSSRPQTKAAEFKNLVNPETIRLRCDKLNKLATACRKKFMQKFITSLGLVLIEEEIRGNPAYLEGLTDNYLKVRLPFRPDLKNTIITARLKSIRSNGFIGEYVDNP
jgi:threonylcarbamoyladenosine tRNA methylthiotransferase MtaB